jgi:transposase
MRFGIPKTQHSACPTRLRVSPSYAHGWVRIRGLVVFEATGAYHRGLERYLSLAGQPFIKVNPKQARRFAQAIGRLAKTDSVDARMLARMGVVLDLAPQGIEGEDVHDLRELLTARRAMVKDQITAKTRLASEQPACEGPTLPPDR